MKISNICNNHFFLEIKVPIFHIQNFGVLHIGTRPKAYVIKNCNWTNLKIKKEKKLKPPFKWKKMAPKLGLQIYKGLVLVLF